MRPHDTDLTHCFTQGINHTPVPEWIRKRRVKQWKEGQKERKGNQWSRRERTPTVTQPFFSGRTRLKKKQKGGKEIECWSQVCGPWIIRMCLFSFHTSRLRSLPFTVCFTCILLEFHSLRICSLLSLPVWSCYPVYVSPWSNGSHNIKSEVVWFERGAWERRQTQSDFSTSFLLFLKFWAFSGTFWDDARWKISQIF